MPEHVHSRTSIPPEYSVANRAGLLKGKSAIGIHRAYLGRQQDFTVFHFWAGGYRVSTIGLDEQTFRGY